MNIRNRNLFIALAGLGILGSSATAGAQMSTSVSQPIRAEKLGKDGHDQQIDQGLGVPTITPSSAYSSETYSAMSFDNCITARRLCRHRSLHLQLPSNQHGHWRTRSKPTLGWSIRNQQHLLIQA